MFKFLFVNFKFLFKKQNFTKTHITVLENLDRMKDVNVILMGPTLKKSIDLTLEEINLKSFIFVFY